MSAKPGFGRVILGFLVVAVISTAAAGVWHGALGKGIPMKGQWDPTVGPVGPVDEEAEAGLLTLEQSYQRYVNEEVNTFILFVDARTPDHFEEGHIEGAINVPAVFDQVDDYRALYDEFLTVHPPEEGLPIVIYCNGADCTDSHELREKFFEAGYYDMYIMFQGYPEWKEAGYPVVESESAVTAPVYTASPLRPLWLVSMIAAILFAIGSAVHPLPRKLWTCKWVALAFRLLLGGVFIAASFYKIQDPGEFAKSVYQYGVVPGDMINLFAMLLPWMEAIAGVMIILGCFTRGAALAIAAMLLSFTIALGINVAQGKSLDCGCFKSASEEKDSDPISLIYRDIAMLILAMQVVGVTTHPGVGSLFGSRSGGSRENEPEGAPAGG